jgi:hypothetical protein
MFKIDVAVLNELGNLVSEYGSDEEALKPSDAGWRT